MAIEFELVETSQPERWNQALDALAHGYWHGWRACRAMQAGTALPHFLCVAHDASGILAACPIAEREWDGTRDLFTPVGFSGFAGVRPPPAGLRQAWTAFAAGRGYVAGYFALHPLFAIESAHTGLVSDNELFIVELDAGGDAALARCDRSVQRSLRSWERDGRRYVTCRQTLTRFILEHYAACMVALGADPRTVWPPATLAAMCEDPDLLMVGAADEEGVCAVHTFAITTHAAECHLSFSVRDGRHFTAALIGWGIRQLADRGLPALNLGGGMRRGDSLAQSKLKFRPRRVPFLRAREVYRPDQYRLLCARAGADPATGFHPAYRAGERAAQDGGKR